MGNWDNWVQQHNLLKDDLAKATIELERLKDDEPVVIKPEDSEQKEPVYQQILPE